MGEPISSLEIIFDEQTTHPRIKLNGCDFHESGMGIVSLKVDWQTYDGTTGDNFLEIEYLDQGLSTKQVSHTFGRGL